METAIIGLGACGVNVLRELYKYRDQLNDLKITIIQDDAHQLKTGLPYQEDHEELWLNVYPKFMSMNVDNHAEFIEYLMKEKIDVGRFDFVSRTVFGKYLTSIVDEILESDMDIEVINSAAQAISLNDDQTYTIQLANGQSKQVDSIHLSTGHLAYNDPYQLIDYDQFIYNPYPVLDKLMVIADHHKVAIVGAGLSAVDFLMYLKKDDDNRPVDMFSLEGLTKTARGKNYQDQIRLNHSLPHQLLAYEKELGRPLEVADIMSQFKKDVEEHGVDFDYYWNERTYETAESLKLDFEEMEQLNTLQSCIMPFKENINDLWAHLSEEVKEEFLAEQGSIFNVYGAPIPAERAKAILEYIDAGSLQVRGGMEDVEYENGKFTIITKNREFEGYDFLINATGQSLVLTEENIPYQSELVQQLLRDNLAETYDKGGFKVDYPTYSLIHPEKGKLDNFKVYGQLSSGIDPFNNSIVKLRNSTHQGTEAFVKWVQSN